jgi:hypothetical protein
LRATSYIPELTWNSNSLFRRDNALSPALRQHRRSVLNGETAAVLRVRIAPVWIRGRGAAS